MHRAKCLRVARHAPICPLTTTLVDCVFVRFCWTYWNRERTAPPVPDVEEVVPDAEVVDAAPGNPVTKCIGQSGHCIGACLMGLVVTLLVIELVPVMVPAFIVFFLVLDLVFTLVVPLLLLFLFVISLCCSPRSERSACDLCIETQLECTRCCVTEPPRGHLGTPAHLGCVPWHNMMVWSLCGPAECPDCTAPAPEPKWEECEPPTPQDAPPAQADV